MLAVKGVNMNTKEHMIREEEGLPAITTADKVIASDPRIPQIRLQG